jgi:hypothetical protein
MEYVYGILIGGTLISALGAISSYNIENKEPSIKSISRDFIIGSILFLLIMQLLPESSLSIISYLTAMLPTNLVSISSPVDDMDIQVGIPQF